MISYLSTKKTNLNPLKENLRYTANQEFLSCGLDMTNSYVCNLPHNFTLWGVIKSYNKIQATKQVIEKGNLQMIKKDTLFLELRKIFVK
ncbi:hypothetical protein [Helicobacter cetorum]|uniref:CagY like protein n=1 Tax=Helicobacter cetorum (strain ATCC BAA-540 / CCUG 52418 / MIT 99-5656) TaxID=1163745 RepID=I0ESF2_HELCM|nr:hypothetical protein [Helicobacter cetorum]AFI05871.1 cagY like protein [Helicobacter cetorum MIT 99-5656]